MYKLRVSYIRFLKKCIKEVKNTSFTIQKDKDFILNNYNNGLRRLESQKSLFTKIN